MTNTFDDIMLYIFVTVCATFFVFGMQYALENSPLLK